MSYPSLLGIQPGFLFWRAFSIAKGLSMKSRSDRGLRARVPRSVAKYVRRRKAELRKQFEGDPEAAKQAIKTLTNSFWKK